MDSSDDSSFDRKLAADAADDSVEEQKLLDRKKQSSEVALQYSRELQRLGLGGSLAPATWAKPFRSPDEKKKLLEDKVARLDHAERRPSKRVAVLVDISDSEEDSSSDSNDNSVTANDSNERGQASLPRSFSERKKKNSDSSRRSPSKKSSSRRGVEEVKTSPSKRSKEGETIKKEKSTSSKRSFHIKQEQGDEANSATVGLVKSPLEQCLSLAMQLHVASEQLTRKERKKCRAALVDLDGIENLAALIGGAAARKIRDDQPAPPLPVFNDLFVAETPALPKTEGLQREEQETKEKEEEGGKEAGEGKGSEKNDLLVPSIPLPSRENEGKERKSSVDSGKKKSEKKKKKAPDLIHVEKEAESSDASSLIRSHSLPVLSRKSDKNTRLAEPGTPRSRAKRRIAMLAQSPRLPSKDEMLKN